MRVHVLYFGVLKELLGQSGVWMDIAEGTTVAGLLEMYGEMKGASKVRGSLAVAVNQEYAGAADVLKDGDEVALLPPVSGGL